MESYNSKILYKLGKENYISYALSRRHLAILQNEMEIDSDNASIHSEESLTYSTET